MMSIDIKTYEENRFIYRIYKLIGIILLIIAIIFTVMIINFIIFIMPIIALYCFSIYILTLKRFEITKDYIQFPKKIANYNKINIKDIIDVKFIITNHKVYKNENIRIILKNGDDVYIRMSDDLNIDQFLILKTSLNLG